MEKKDLVQILDQEFKPIGFKREGNYWRLVTEDLEKIIYLQRSSFSKLYYVNYGFNLLNVDYQPNWIQVSHRLGSKDKEINKLISDLLDLENDIDDDHRKVQLRKFIGENMKVTLCRVNSIGALKIELSTNNRILNKVPIRIKEYLGV